MSKIEKEMCKVLNKDVEYNVLRGVKFGSIKLKLPASKVGSGDKVFKVEFFVDKATKKELSKKYSKLSIEEIENEDIERRFKMEVPFPDQDEQFKVSMSVKASRPNKKGETMELWKDEFMDMILRPKVYNRQGDNLTAQMFFASGAIGDVYFSEKAMEGKDDGLKFTHPYMFKIVLDEYKEYEKKA